MGSQMSHRSQEGMVDCLSQPTSDAEMIFSPAAPWNRSTSTLCSSIFGTAMPDYACDLPDEAMPANQGRACSQPITPASSAGYAGYAGLGVPVTSLAARSNGVVMAYHLPFPTPPPSSPEFPPRRARVRIASGSIDSPHFTRQGPSDPPVQPRKLSKTRSRRSPSVDEGERGPLVVPSSAPAAQQLSSPSILIKPTRKLSLVLKRGLGSLRRHSRVVRSKDNGDHHHEQPQLGMVWDDPFERISTQGANPIKTPPPRTPQRSQRWKTHARRTLSKSGKESISLPMESPLPSGPFSPNSEPFPVTPSPEGTYVPLRSPTSNRSPTVWRTSLSLFTSRPPLRPASRPVLFSRVQQPVVQTWEHSSTTTIQLQRLAALARLEGKSTVVPSFEGSVEMDKDIEWSALEYVWLK